MTQSLAYSVADSKRLFEASFRLDGFKLHGFRLDGFGLDAFKLNDVL